MSTPEHSLRKLQPDFIISPGTQVVVKVAKPLPGGEDYKPAGSVGIVVEAPPSNREAYLVRFTDGATVTPCYNLVGRGVRDFGPEGFNAYLRPFWFLWATAIGSCGDGRQFHDTARGRLRRNRLSDAPERRLRFLFAG